MFYQRMIVVLSGALWFVLGSAATAQDAALKREINQAVDKGVDYLKGLQRKDGTWPRDVREERPFSPHQIGATALAALALLESGVPATDAGVQRAAAVVRESAPGLNYTYSVSLAVLFLDRLGDPGDEAYIQVLAVRLLAGQNRTGAWAYHCFERHDQSGATRELTPNEVLAMDLYLKHRRQQEGKEVRPPAPEPRKPGPAKRLPRELLLRIDQIYSRPLPDAFSQDNSNTQFATLALWVSRRHGVPVDRALALVESRFRSTQIPATWGWDYEASTVGGPPNPAMTCAGLIGLAAGHGSALARKGPRRDLTKDLNVKAGLMALGMMIGDQANGHVKQAIHGGKGYYFLWTLERMAVLYDLKTIGGKDWYVWGAQLLIAKQQADGSWNGFCADGGCDTSFALLFLKRANVAQDLTASLKGMVKDPVRDPLMLKMIGKSLSKEPPPAVQPTPVQPKDPAPPKESPTPAPQPREGEAAKLTAALVAAAAPDQDALLQKLRDTPGPTYTQALAGAIPKLRGTAKTRARHALAQRFERLDADALRAQLRSSELELRRAAAVASGAKKARALVPDLINLLEDQEATVLEAAHASLRRLTSQDFGPELDASRAERAAAVDAWRKWWKQQKP